MLRKLFRMGLPASRVRSETKNANGDFELSLSHLLIKARLRDLSALDPDFAVPH
jgi:hypothetical protein